MKRECDVIIIGGGIAGCFMAFQHLKRGKSVILINKEVINSSSKVAAGLYNPIMLKHFTKSWLAEELFPFLNQFYPKLQSFLGDTIFHQTPIAKLFSSTHEQNKWLEASDHTKTIPFVSLEKEKLPTHISQNFSHGLVKNSGWVNTITLTDSMKQKLGENYFNTSINYENIRIHENEISISIENTCIQSKKIIFCEGFKAKNNPFFKHIKFTPTMGEVLTIKSVLDLKNIIHRAGFIVPLGNNTYKVGTTYNKNIDEQNLTSTQGKLELSTIFSHITSSPYKPISHQGAIRPNIYDRRPILGAHPKYSNLYIFNGLGSKGVSLGPYFSEILYQNMYEHKEISKEVHYQRFIDRFS